MGAELLSVRDIFPESFAAGLTFQAYAIRYAFPPADGWTMTAALRGPSVINLTGTVNAAGNGFEFTAPPSTTAEWLPGRYWYQIIATDAAGDVCQVEYGEIVINPNLSAQDAGYSGLSHAETVLQNLEAVIENKATQDQQRYRINNRELTRMSPAELIKWRDYYWQLVQRERLKMRGKSIFSQQLKMTTFGRFGRNSR
jgi:hypothetical protein